MLRNIDLHDESTILLTLILPPPLVDGGDIVENQFDVDEQ